MTVNSDLHQFSQLGKNWGRGGVGINNVWGGV